MRVKLSFPRKPATLIVLGLVAVAGATGLALGYVAAKKNIPHALKERVLAVFDGKDDIEVSHWQELETTYGVVDIARLQVADNNFASPAAIAEVGNHILMLSKTGKFSYLSAAGDLRPLAIDLPMHVDELLASPLAADQNFNIEFFRALDLHAVEAGPHAFDVYASYAQFEGRCFQVVLSRLRINTTDNGLVTPHVNWTDIYASKPCVPPKTRSHVFAGHQIGGRIVALNPQTLLLSLGDFEFDGNTEDNGTTNEPQNPASDIGKVIAIDLATGASSHYAQGFRNPQGLLADSAGRVWLTEHGPRGGDEVNLIAEGQDYGWPTVTYGMQYSSPPVKWATNTTFAGHEGFAKPKLIFSPGIGISNIIEPSPAEFPFWSGDLMLSSLNGMALYMLRVEDNDILFAERIEIGEEIRDIISQRNGKVAMIGERGGLFLMRGHMKPGHEGYTAEVRAAGYKALTAPLKAGADSLKLPPRETGRRVFERNCASCHSVTDQASAGPTLRGVVGRNIGSVESYPYSRSMKAARGSWTADRLRAFVMEDGANAFPGTPMTPMFLPEEQAGPLVEYLRTIG